MRGKKVKAIRKLAREREKDPAMIRHAFKSIKKANRRGGQ